MISKSELIRKLKRELGSNLFRLVTEEKIYEILHDETLMTYSEFYPKLVRITITRDQAVPFQDYNGKVWNNMYYKIPNNPTPTGEFEPEQFEWRDLENYYIAGNDSSDVYSGGNFMLNQFFLSASASMPHTRSYFIVSFEEPDTLIIDPPQQTHRNFTVVMQANRTLKTIPRNMQRTVQNLFVCDMKLYLYNEYQHDEGSQVYGGIEIQTKIDTFKEAESERDSIIQEMEKDWFKNPERFEVIALYQGKY